MELMLFLILIYHRIMNIIFIVSAERDVPANPEQHIH